MNLKKIIPLALSILLGCARPFNIQTGTPSPYKAPLDQVRAGIAQTDLTPPPGYPMNGYSVNGKISRGYWIKPKATALYIQDHLGKPFIFVTTDLWAITEGQKMQVLKLLQQDPATSFIGESELMLSATHSHHSIGVNVPDYAYDLSSVVLSGFDNDAFDFTTQRIYEAIRAAIDSSGKATISVARREVKGVAKNRSINAYLRNHPSERKQYLGHDPATYRSGVTREEIESMIDRSMCLITVKDSAGKIKGILGSYSVHPTSTGDATQVYSSDLFGLAAKYISDSLASDNPIVAFYNGAEGDVAPDYSYHNRADAVCIAKQLSEAVLLTVNTATPIDKNSVITHRTGIVDLMSNKVAYDTLDENCFCRIPEQEISTASYPVAGAAVFAGASDGRTSLSSFGICDGIKTESWDLNQGYKMAAGDFLTSKALGKTIPKFLQKPLKKALRSHPISKMPVSIHQVGGIYFVGLPGEFTTMAGRRIRKAIVQGLKTGGLQTSEDNIWLVGLADGYTSYVTTPCEYDDQAYEGASDYFGFATGEVFIKEYKKLAEKNPDRAEDRHGRTGHFKVGKKVTYGPAHLGELQTWNAEEGLQNLLVAEDGTKLHSHHILPYVISNDTDSINPSEAVAYSFVDSVREIKSDRNFYPEVSLRFRNKTKIRTPEYIFTIDEYSKQRTVWTIRIPDISFLKGEAAQIVVKNISSMPTYNSQFFIRK